MKILITGVYGFLGSHLANALCKNKTFQVFGLYHTTQKEGLSENIQTFNTLDGISFQPEIVIMCHAAVSSGTIEISEEKLKQNNIQDTENIIKAFPQARYIYISTASIYENDGQVISERSPDRTLNLYAESKKKAEELIRKHNAYNLCIRLSSLYGIGMKENTLIPNYCNQALKNNKIEVWGEGIRKQNYIHVDDVIRLIEKGIKVKSVINFPLLAVSQKEYSNLEVAQLIAKCTNAEIKFINEDNSHSVAYTNVETQQKTHWTSITTLEEGIKKYLEWKQKQF